MKKLLALAVCVGTAVVALGADGTVNFNNRMTIAGIDARVLGPDGNPVSGADGFVAQLAYTATEGGAMTPFGDVVSFYGDKEVKYGYVNGGVQSIADMAGQNVWIQMQAWNTNDGASYADAVAAGGPAGVSNIIPVKLGGDGVPPALPANLVGLQGFQLQPGEVIPEPSTFALGLIGIGALLLRRRK
jgi:hypothetical protein